MSTIFQKIIDKEIPADIVYEDETAVAFRDINPQAPLHVLIVPRRPIARVTDATEEDRETLGHLFWVARRVAEQEGFEDFRLVVNCGRSAGQEVFHVHVHMLAGRSFGWPPG